ncbi:MAG: ferrochelatase [Alphaproteobacteria bacterium]|nr:ferrochelatase [Alphaproteobacteria bacterium]
MAAPSSSRTRTAIVLFNLGGPDSLASVRPFLERLFSDPAIIKLPWILRRPLAWLIARLRAPSAQANYAIMGGASPLLAETKAQAEALEQTLAQALPGRDIRVLIAMRYWKPFTEDAAREAARWDAEEVVLLPLYPQFSTTTSGSSLKAWRRAFKGRAKVRTVCCWYDEAGFVSAHAERISKTWEAAGRPAVRLLFSAHGLPEQIVAGGDPYQHQIEATCAKVVEALGGTWDWEVCYQSRVGPLKWLGPSTPEAITRAGEQGLGVLIDPIAFVSDHIETLVELDREYAEMAHELGATPFLRAPVVGTHPAFVSGLARAIAKSLTEAPGLVSPCGEACPARFGQCPRTTNEARS